MNQEQREVANRVMEKAQRQIWITWQKEGIHKYPAALTDPALADVNVGPLVKVSDPPLPSLRVSARVKLDKLVLPLFSTVIV